MQATPPNKILLVRFSALGDVVQTLPVLTMLREGFPQAKIGWAIDAELAPVVEGHPALDYLHRCSRRSWLEALRHPQRWSAAMAEFNSFVDEVRAVRYDVSIDAQGLFKTALLPYLAGIRHRIGYKNGREFSSLFYNEVHATPGEYFDPAIFHLEHMAQLARTIGAKDLRYAVEPPTITEPARGRVRRLLECQFDQPAPIVVISPATQWTSKHWPEEHWSALLCQLLAESDLNVIFQGAAFDGEVSARIVAAVSPALVRGRVLNLCGQVPVQDMFALYELAQAAIGPDSAPLHIAGAVGVPVLVGIYGPTGYRRTPPIGSPHIRLLSTEGQLECQPCHKRVCPLGTGECMVRIRPVEVFEVLVNALAEAGINVNTKRQVTVS